MANVRCPACSTVFNPSQPQSITRAPTAANASPASGEAADESASRAPLIAGVVAGAILLMSMVGLLAVMVSRMPEKTPRPVVTEPPQQASVAAREYREVALPEATRRSIYDDYRAAARTTVEKPLLLPEGTKVRANLEDMLQKTLDRELSHFAALHDVTVDDIREIIAEGDAKNWDPRPRSHATRDGKRLYPEEMSEGWQNKPGARSTSP